MTPSGESNSLAPPTVDARVWMASSIIGRRFEIVEEWIAAGLPPAALDGETIQMEAVIVAVIRAIGTPPPGGHPALPPTVDRADFDRALQVCQELMDVA